jgi:hypothetical protein
VRNLNKKAVTPRILYVLLFVYAGITGTYEVANSVSMTAGTFNLRDQVQAPFQLYGNFDRQRGGLCGSCRPREG